MFPSIRKYLSVRRFAWYAHISNHNKSSLLCRLLKYFRSLVKICSHPFTGLSYIGTPSLPIYRFFPPWHSLAVLSARWSRCLPKYQPLILSTNYTKNSKWVRSGNTTITNCRQTHGTARKRHTTITRHQEDRLSKATSSLFPIKMIAKLEWT